MMNRYLWLGWLCAGCFAADKVDFSYAFAPPHRITVAAPSSSNKTLLDLEPGSLTAHWTYDDLRGLPLGDFRLDCGVSSFGSSPYRVGK